MAEFEFVPHTADIAIRARGTDLADLLRAAALGVSAAVAGVETLVPYRAPGVAPRALQAEGGPDEEGLLVGFLNEVIFQGEVNGEVYTEYEINTLDLDAGATALAYPDPALAPTHAVKAATYYDLHVTHGPTGLEATVVCDV